MMGAVPEKSSSSFCLGILDVDQRKKLSVPATCGHFMNSKKKDSILVTDQLFPEVGGFLEAFLVFWDRLLTF